PFYELGDGQWNIPDLRRLLIEVVPEDKRINDYEIKLQFPDLGSRTMLLNARRLRRESRQEALVLLAIEDVTERKQIEEVRREISERGRAVAVAAALRDKESEIARVSRALALGEMATSIGRDRHQCRSRPSPARRRNSEPSEARDSLALI